MPELVEHGVEGMLVRPGRADDLQEALERLAADPELRARMGARGREKVRRATTWPQPRPSWRGCIWSSAR